MAPPPSAAKSPKTGLLQAALQADREELSIVPMAAGVPVATVAVGNARNAGLLAVRILAASDEGLRRQMVDFQQDLAASAREKGKAVRGDVGRKLGF